MEGRGASVKFGVVLLAAGGSSRFGRPKQLVRVGGETLIRRAARAAVASGASEVVVVVGHEAERISRELEGLPLRIVENDAWRNGMGDSIAAGVAALTDSDAPVVVALADQPKVTAAHLAALARTVAEGAAPVVASVYEGRRGAPCAFAPSMRPSLLALSGDAGARDLIRPLENVAEIAFEDAALDIDEPAHTELLGDEEAAPAEALEGADPSRAPPVALAAAST